MEIIIEIMFVLLVILLAKKEEQYEKQIAELKQDYEDRLNGANATIAAKTEETVKLKTESDALQNDFDQKMLSLPKPNSLSVLWKVLKPTFHEQ